MKIYQLLLLIKLVMFLQKIQSLYQCFYQNFGVHQLDLFRIKYLSHFFGKLEKTQAVDFQNFKQLSSITYQAFFNNLSRAVVGVALPDTICKNTRTNRFRGGCGFIGLFCAMTNAMILETTLTAKALDSSDSATI